MKKLSLFYLILLSALCSRAETWVSIGKGLWEDCLFGVWQTREVSFERSIERQGVYRTTPYIDYNNNNNPPVIIHVEDPEKIWLEKFSVSNYRFTHEYYSYGKSAYGMFYNGTIMIPDVGREDLLTSQRVIFKGFPIKITLPDGFNTPIDYKSGIYMGIISFNDKIDNLPIFILNKDTESKFIDFVNNMEMENATLLYYAVDNAITSIGRPNYPANLSNAVIITFTDGLDQGSLAMKPEQMTSRNYAQYLSDRISSTSINGQQLQAYTIGLKSNDVADDELFMLNLKSLASSPEKALPVTDIEGVKTELTKIYEELYRQTSQRVISIIVPMMSHGDRYRFTLDGTTDQSKVNNSEMWIDGEFDITNFSLNNVQYHGFTSTSVNRIVAEQDGVYIKFTFTDCRTEDGDILEIEKNDIDQWSYISSGNIWQHNVENDKEGKIDIEDVRTSAAVMFVLDCSRSLGELFPVLKETANSFIDRLAGGNSSQTEIKESVSDDKTIIDELFPIEYFNLQGIRVANPQNGIYIRRQGKKMTKILIQ